MKKNLSSIDRIIRLMLGFLFAALFFSNTVTGTMGVVLLAAGVVLALTAFVSFCPLYWVFGWSTCRKTISVK